jgi:hypothetical protein
MPLAPDSAHHLVAGSPAARTPEVDALTARGDRRQIDLEIPAINGGCMVRFSAFSPLLLCYHSTGNAITGISGGIGLHIVGMGVDN